MRKEIVGKEEKRGEKIRGKSGTGFQERRKLCANHIQESKKESSRETPKISSKVKRKKGKFGGPPRLARSGTTQSVLHTAKKKKQERVEKKNEGEERESELRQPK